MNNSKYLLVILLLLNSCIPGEDPVAPFDRGGIISSAVSMGDLYSEQIYFSLDADAIVAQNKLTDWDIGFSSQDNNFSIIMNYGKFMAVYELDSVNFESIDAEFVKALPDTGWKYDDPEGDLDSTAIGIWWLRDSFQIESKGKTYIIDRGMDEKAKKQGFVKFRIDKFADETYYITYADVKDNLNFNVSIKKDPLYNYTQLLFDKTGCKVTQLEPPRENWDLLFTKYTDLLYADGFSMWYSVTGAYINPNKMRVAYLESDDFQSINSSVVDTSTFSWDRNKIGHEWKDYDLQNGVYFVYPKKVYIIYSVTGFYYKLHFTDFYDVNGVKGTPNFEFQKL